MSSLREIKARIEACKDWEEPVPDALMQEYRRLRRKFLLPKKYRCEIDGLQRVWRRAGKSPAKDRYLPFLCRLYGVACNWRARGNLERMLRLAAKQYRIAIKADIFKLCLHVGTDGDPLDRRTRYRWQCVLRYAHAFDVPPQTLRRAIKAAGGVNACARRWQLAQRYSPNMVTRK